MHFQFYGDQGAFLEIIEALKKTATRHCVFRIKKGVMTPHSIFYDASKNF
jgi:hypothetical protein